MLCCSIKDDDSYPIPPSPPLKHKTSQRITQNSVVATRSSEMILKVWSCLLACEWDALTQVHSPNGPYLQASVTLHLCLCPNGQVLVQLSLVKKDRNPHRSVVKPECCSLPQGWWLPVKVWQGHRMYMEVFMFCLTYTINSTKWGIGDKLKDILIS